jgi:hypothetical protein
MGGAGGGVRGWIAVVDGRETGTIALRWQKTRNFTGIVENRGFVVRSIGVSNGRHGCRGRVWNWRSSPGERLNAFGGAELNGVPQFSSDPMLELSFWACRRSG